MSLLERDTVMVSTDEAGNAVVDLPHTRANNVEGLGRSKNTYYSVGNVVYVDSNLSVALKCTQAGTTSNTELDISTKNIGDTVTDGSVVWQVCNRTSDVTSVNGKTGDVVVGEIVDASISGKKITLTFADGTTKTLTTQDTAPYSGSATSIGGASTTSPAVVVETYKSGATWYRKWSDGWVEQGGIKAAAVPSITFPKPFKNTDYYFNLIGNKTSRANYEYGWVSSRSTTGAVVLIVDETAYWYACGQGA